MASSMSSTTLPERCTRSPWIEVTLAKNRGQRPWDTVNAARAYTFLIECVPDR